MDPNERLEKLKRLQSLREQQLLRQNPAGTNEASALPDTAFGQAMQNAPGSAAQLVKDTASAVTHPIETAKGVAHAITNPDEVVAALADRYGGAQNIKETFINDPMGAISDVIGLVSGGGSVMARLPGIDKVPKSLMESAVKFPTRDKPKDVDKKVKALLDNGINPVTESGLKKLNKIVTEINADIDKIISLESKAGTKIDASKIISSIDERIKDRDVPGVFRADDTARLTEIKQQFIDSLDGRGSLSPAEAQRIKKDIFERTNFDARQGSATFIGEEGQKAIASGARQSLNEVDPRIQALNARQGPLLDVSPDAERAQQRVSNKEPLGLTGAIGAAAGGASGTLLGAGATGAVVGAVTGKALASNRLQARAAIMMQRLIDAGQSPASAHIIVQQVLTQMGRTREQQQ